MQYRIQNKSYREFETYEQNKRAPRTYFVPYSSQEALRAVPDARQRYESDLVTVLSGAWGFRYYPDAAQLPREIDTDTLGFDEIPVPSTWQRTGPAGEPYEAPAYINVRYPFEDMPPNLPEQLSAGIYCKRFQLEQPDAGSVIVSFLGVMPCVDLYCNGYHIGYSEGAHNTAEFDLSDVVRPGENELVAVVHKWCTGTFLECQDMFRENGIFRDVLLYVLPKTHLNDYWLRPLKTPEGDYRLQCTAEVHGEPAGWSLELSIEGLDAKYTGPAKERMSFALDKLEVQEWNAEQPVLYTAWLKLCKNGEPMQVVKQPIGFKTIEIQGNLFLFNGKAIKLKGVNHHDTNPKTGYCMTYEDYEQDLRLMKDLNVNAIRTSHYPPDPHLLALADKLGFYVIDEADIEAHGTGHLGDIDMLSNDKNWIPRYLDRVKRMLFRDRNHACVTMWSLGNEAGGWRCQDACYAFLHAVHPEIPVHYEGVCRTPVFGYDVYSEMYTAHEKVLRIGKGEEEQEEIRKRPFFLCEYAHAMGNGPGGLADYWDIFYQYDNLMGGCIWEWADHAVDHGEDAALRYTYGGDHGERIHDGNFCVDGLVYPDRTPHTGAWAMKNIYRTVRAEQTEAGISFRNTDYFANAVYTLEWALRKNGEVIQAGTQALDIPPQEAIDIALPLPALEDSAEYHLDLHYNKDGEAAFEQLALREDYIEQDTTAGGDISDVLQTLKLNFLRAWIDNDNWRNWVEPDYAPQNLIVKDNGDVYAGDEVQFHMHFITEELPGGAVRVTAKLDPADTMLDGLQIARFGVTMELPHSWECVRYYGLGEKENMPDMTELAKIGVYETTVDAMHEPYVYPQDNGNRGQVRWLELTDEAGKGVRICNAPGKLSFSAHHYTQQQLTDALHQEDLRRDGPVFLSVDGFVRGSGSSSCGPDALEQYRIELSQGLEFSFVIAGI